MTNRAGIHRTYDSSFLLDEARLRKVTNVFDEFGKRLDRPFSVLFEVERADDSFYETEDIGVVLEDDNATGKEIQRIIIQLLVGTPQTKASGIKVREIAARVVFGHVEDRVLFDDETEVSFQIIERGRDWCFLFADELDTQIRRTLTHRIRRFPARLFDALLGLGAVGVLIGVSVPWLTLTKNLSAERIRSMSADEKLTRLLTVTQEQNTHLMPFILILSVCGILLIGAIELKPVTRIRNWMSQSVFYWGDFVAVHDRNKARASNIVWVVIVGFVISILASIAYTWFSTR